MGWCKMCQKAYKASNKESIRLKRNMVLRAKRAANRVLPRTFGEMVAHKRKEAGMSQATLAGIVGVGVNTLSRVETRDGDVGRSTAVAIGRALRMTAREICLP